MFIVYKDKFMPARKNRPNKKGTNLTMDREMVKIFSFYRTQIMDGEKLSAKYFIIDKRRNFSGLKYEDYIIYSNDYLDDFQKLEKEEIVEFVSTGLIKIGKNWDKFYQRYLLKEIEKSQKYGEHTGPF